MMGHKNKKKQQKTSDFWLTLQLSYIIKIVYGYVLQKWPRGVRRGSAAAQLRFESHQ